MIGLPSIIRGTTRFIATKVAEANGHTEEEAKKIGRKCGWAASGLVAILTLDVSGLSDIGASASDAAIEVANTARNGA